jgi:hypothetical protein
LRRRLVRRLLLQPALKEYHPHRSGRFGGEEREDKEALSREVQGREPEGGDNEVRSYI